MSIFTQLSRREKGYKESMKFLLSKASERTNEMEKITLGSPVNVISLKDDAVIKVIVNMINKKHKSSRENTLSLKIIELLSGNKSSLSKGRQYISSVLLRNIEYIRNDIAMINIDPKTEEEFDLQAAIRIANKFGINK